MANPGSSEKPRRRKFHKRRVVENVSDTEHFFSQRFDPDATGDRGLWCGECHKRIPWRELTVEYSHHAPTDTTFRAWFCVCGDQLREDDMTDLALVHEDRRDR